MIKAVFDANVLISAMLTPTGTPGQLLARWDEGEFELVVSARLLEELERATQYPKLKRRLDASHVNDLLDALKDLGHDVVDPNGPAPIQSEDPRDDYLIALALKADAALVSGDRHLTDLRGTIPVFSPAEFLDYLAAA